MRETGWLSPADITLNVSIRLEGSLAHIGGLEASTEEQNLSTDT